MNYVTKDIYTKETKELDDKISLRPTADQINDAMR